MRRAGTVSPATVSRRVLSLTDAVAVTDRPATPDLGAARLQGHRHAEQVGQPVLRELRLRRPPPQRIEDNPAVGEEAAAVERDLFQVEGDEGEGEPVGVDLRCPDPDMRHRPRRQ